MIGLISGSENVNHDARDAKIVSLAKKCRNLSDSLRKEKTAHGKIVKTHEELAHRFDVMEQQHEKVIDNRVTEIHTSQENGDLLERIEYLESHAKQMKKASEVSAKQAEQLRHKNHQHLEENKRLKRIIVKEVGEEMSQELIDGKSDSKSDGASTLSATNWRGRAQQIVMLKGKLKKLEAAVLEKEELSSGSGASAAESLKRSAMRRAHQRSSNVDTKAEELLTAMESERHSVMEAITEDKAKLEAEVLRLSKRVTSQSARVQVLEKQMSSQRDSLITMVSKADSDDNLISLLRAENGRLKESLRTAKLEATSSPLRVRKEGGSGLSSASTFTSMAGSTGTPAFDQSMQLRDNAELKRLQRLCEHQAQQIETQEKLIQDLRATAQGGYQ